MATLYSIGYGNRPWDKVRDLLTERNCGYLIDVRSNPFSKFNPSFGKESLLASCGQAGIQYVFMGDTLGGKPVSDEHFDLDGKVNYSFLAAGDDFRRGLARLVNANKQEKNVCIMCSELRPEECHRCKLIGCELSKQGIDVLHIDESGLDVPQNEAIRRLTGGQSDMFGEPPEISRSRGTYKK